MSRADPFRTRVFAVLIGVSGVLNVVNIPLVGLVVQAAQQEVASGGAADSDLVPALVAFTVVTVLNALRGRVAVAVEQVLRLRVRQDVEQRMLDMALAPSGVAHLDNPTVADPLVNLRSRFAVVDPGDVVGAASAFTAQWLNAAGLTVTVVVAFAWWAPIAPLLAAVALHALMSTTMFALVSSFVSQGMPLRRAAYLRELALTAAPAKDLRVFGLGPWLTDAFREAWQEGMRAVWADRRKTYLRMWVTLIALALGAGAVIVVAGFRAIDGNLSLASFVIVARAIPSLAVAGGYLGPHLWGAMAAAMIKGFEVLEAHPAILAATLPEAAVEAPPLRESLSLQGVTFSYGQDAPPVLDGLTLDVAAGSSVAIVGANGAGKTTLVKLLCRLFDPQQGEVLVDGVPLPSYSTASWRRRVAMVPQGFTRLELTLRENVDVAGAGLDDTDIEAALLAAQGAELLEDLSRGLDTVLAAGYPEGRDLSGGQWQKVAVARALASAGPGGLLILDEPTASLDVRAEANLFDHVVAATQGVTTILVSHRFSTVRRAERILVLEGGKVVEDGSHEHLLQLGGTYARMYTLQAQAFVDLEPEVAP